MSSDESTMPLFPDEPAPAPQGRPAPTSRPQAAVRIVAASAAPLTKDQKTFNKLLKDIENARRQLMEWNEAIPAFRHRYAQEVMPLQAREIDCKRQLIRAFDEAHERKGTTKTEKKKLGVLIMQFAEQALELQDDETCMALHAKYSGWGSDEDDAAMRETMRDMLESVFDIDLDGVDLSSPDEVIRLAGEKLAAQAQQQEEPAPRKKTAKQLEREAKRVEEEKLASQSIREVYRKLASALHPDRETDPEEKRRKTELMQLANDAYEKGNLLELLELQLQLEQIDAAHLAAIDTDRLKRYIGILKEQLEELDAEIILIVGEFADEFGHTPWTLPAPARLGALVDDEVRLLEEGFEYLQEIVDATKDAGSLKAWLKTVKLQRRPASFDYSF